MIPSWLTARFVGVVLLSLMVALIGAVVATDYDWVGGDGDWDVNNNWDPNTGYPGDSVVPTDTATIATDQGGDTINVIDVEIDELTLRRVVTFTSQEATGTITVNGPVVIHAFQNQGYDTVVVVTDSAAIDTAG